MNVLINMIQDKSLLVDDRKFGELIEYLYNDALTVFDYAFDENGYAKYTKEYIVHVVIPNKPIDNNNEFEIMFEFTDKFTDVVKVIYESVQKEPDVCLDLDIE